MEAREKFLDQVMSQYATSAPQLSSHLAYDRIQASLRQDKGKKRKWHIAFCRACGTPAIAGWTQKRSLQHKDSSTSTALRGARKRGQASLVAVDTCTVCRRSVEAPVERKPRPAKFDAQVGHKAEMAKSEVPIRTKRTSNPKSLLARLKADERQKASASSNLGFSDFFKS